MGGLTFGKTTEGEWGYKPEGADAVIPFNTFDGEITLLLNGTIGSSNTTITYDLGKYADYKAIFLAAYYPSTLTFSNPQNVDAKIYSNEQLDAACFTNIKSNSSFQIYKYGTGIPNAIMYGIK